MKKLIRIFAFFAIHVLFVFSTFQKTYQVGDTAQDFSLRNIDGKMLSLANIPAQRGYIVVFTSNYCPFSKLYEDRLIEAHARFSPKGYSVVAINANDSKEQAEDSFEGMQERHRQKNFPFPYLHDADQTVAKTYGATKTPQVFVLSKIANELKVSYIGGIDDAPQDAAGASRRYLEEALNALLSDRKPDPHTTKPVGCSVRWKE